EFDNVFLMLDNFNYSTYERKRLLYVATTRAKTNLTIHLNSNYLDNIIANNLSRIENTEQYLPSNELVLHLSFKDVWLDYFAKQQYNISKLIRGDTLKVQESGCFDQKGNQILKFSTKGLSEIEKLKSSNYILKKAKINFIVYWKKEEGDTEIK